MNSIILTICAALLVTQCKSRQHSELNQVQTSYELADFSYSLLEATIELSIQSYESDQSILRQRVLPNIELVSDKAVRTEIFNFDHNSGIFASSGYFMIRMPQGRPLPVNLIFVSFRGTSNLANFFADINIMPKLFYRGYVHHGFFDAYYSPGSFQAERFSAAARVHKFLETFLKKEEVLGYPIQNLVVFTGHSLGGSLALISAMDMCHPANALMKRITYKCLAYTYAAPRTFDEENQKFFNSFMRYHPNETNVSLLSDAGTQTGFTHYNFQYVGDPVPTGGLESYQHTGNVYRITTRADAGREIYSLTKHSIANVYKVAILDFLYKRSSNYRIQLELPKYLRGAD